MYCAHCGARLRDRAIVDVHMQGFICDHGHRLHRPLVEQAGVLPTAVSVRPPVLDDDVAIFRFWLTDARARSRLPHQLALLCRRFVEITDGDAYQGGRELTFAHCLHCGAEAVYVPGSDPHMTLLRCQHGHEFWVHGSSLYCTIDGTSTTISRDLIADDVPGMVDYYAHHEIVRPWVHPQLRGALIRFSRTVQG
jgi:hypothetical protein